MFLLPYAHYTIKTKLRMQDVISKLENVVEPKQFFRVFRGWGSDHKPYEGKVEEDAFSVYSVIEYGYYFHPMIKGKITSEMGGCSIEMTMHPNLVVLLFMALWVGSIGFSFLSALWPILETILQTGFHETPELFSLGVRGGMLIFGYGLLWRAFKTEVAESEMYFRNLFDENYVKENYEAELYGED